jgi:ABC-type spermidine/putrescine transport system permease subunit I
VILPLTAPGIAAAFMLILVICAGFYVLPATLGGASDGFVANVVAVYALQLVDFNTASAIGVVLVIAVALLSLLYARIARATE